MVHSLVESQTAEWLIKINKQVGEVFIFSVKFYLNSEAYLLRKTSVYIKEPLYQERNVSYLLHVIAIFVKCPFLMFGG